MPVLLAFLAALSAVAAATLPRPVRLAEAGPARTFGFGADAALATLERTVYLAPGRWNMCIPAGCGSAVRDWGADALTYTLFLRWKAAHDASIVPIMAALAATIPTYRTCKLPSCSAWSDVPMWDSVAAARAFEITHDPAALSKAQHAFAMVDRSDAFALGACPAIAYQRPAGAKTRLKTLETDSNYIKAALLLARWTGDRAYLQRAVVKYAAVRRYFLDPILPLYTTYVFDDARQCTQVPHRFFASVNGNMIFNGLTLGSMTGDPSYRADAIATAQAVAQLNDGAGIFANLQADNDVAEPLVEAMYDLATERERPFAQDWILNNAAVAVPAASGAYGRFFGGPPPAGTTSAWSANGGFALAIAAGAIDGDALVPSRDIWSAARFVPDELVGAPATIAFTGRAIALIGTIGERCCEAGHVRVYIDGRETVDNTGIWQNKSPGAVALPNSNLLSWRWATSGPHTIAFEPGIFNAKEGASYLHLQGYELVP